MKPSDLDTMALGTPPATGDDWYFTPRPAEGLDEAEVRIVVNPALEDPARAAEVGPASPGH